MGFLGFGKKNKHGSMPVSMQPMMYRPDATRGTMQDHSNWIWPQGVTQYGARVTNTWQGNQLPGNTNFIPGVHASYSVWSNPRSFYNSPVHSKQYGEGFNIQGYSSVQNATLLYAINQAWLNRVGGPA